MAIVIKDIITFTEFSLIWFLETCKNVWITSLTHTTIIVFSLSLLQ